MHLAISMKAVRFSRLPNNILFLLVVVVLLLFILHCPDGAPKVFCTRTINIPLKIKG